MSRFTTTANNLRIAIDDGAADSYASAAARALLKSGERKVYFLGIAARSYPSLVGLKGAGVTVLVAGQEPSNFLSSSRVLHNEGEMVVVSARVMRQDQWRKVASEIEAEVARGENAG